MSDTTVQELAVTSWLAGEPELIRLEKEIEAGIRRLAENGITDAPSRLIDIDQEIEGIMESVSELCLKFSDREVKRMRELMRHQIRYGAECSSMLDRVCAAYGLDGRNWPKLLEQLKAISSTVSSDDLNAGASR